MVATKVGVREFRAGLANFIESDSPTAVTKHGQTVGYFIPTRGDRTVERAALVAAGRKFDALIAEEGIDIDAAIADFAALRRAESAHNDN
jgi:hypothetical protein